MNVSHKYYGMLLVLLIYESNAYEKRRYRCLIDSLSFQAQVLKATTDGMFKSLMRQTQCEMDFKCKSVP